MIIQNILDLFELLAQCDTREMIPTFVHQILEARPDVKLLVKMVISIDSI